MQAPGFPPPLQPFAIAGQLQGSIVRMMSLGFDPVTAGLQVLFLPDIVAAHIRALDSDIRLAHYTSADNAIKIADSKVLWLRSVEDMNDFTEVEHGVKSVKQAFESDAGRALLAALKNIDPTIAQATVDAVDSLLPSLRRDVFIACLSEHHPTCPRESKYGRLSMWRGYAKQNGVAVVVNMKPMRTITDYFDAYSFPVLYAEQKEVTEKIGSIAEAINANLQLLTQLPREQLLWAMSAMLNYYATCVKHPGFEEEREWRIVHQRRVGVASKLQIKPVTIRGIPQPVVEFPLDINPPDGSGFRLSDVVEQIIIGPTAQSGLIKEAVQSKLAEIGIEDGPNRIYESDVPFRV
ncbi:DUF2971 domain-containing protein [Hyphomicrobium sp. 2TAF46]|uniref:DUF2971 domain-containing protein n=1 Tax=Hyphomicrobium sp. 2TAF46 TaxID=3233019 RepID=UPI003F90A579